jgi:hypothetical protein
MNCELITEIYICLYNTSVDISDNLECGKSVALYSSESRVVAGFKE